MGAADLSATPWESMVIIDPPFGAPQIAGIDDHRP
jgi:hypothetical protein